MNTNRKLTRSTTDRMLGGICGGLAQYLNVDPTFVRLGFVLLALSGVSPLVYLVLWVVIPSETSVGASWTQQFQQSIGEIQTRATTVANEVSSQVQRVASSPSAPTPPADTDPQAPSVGPTTKL